MLADEAEQWAGKELDKFKEFLLQQQAEAYEGQYELLQTGGELVDFPLMDAPAETWQKFQEEFLQ